jgi:tRNA pseudouridine55 synthase
MIKEKKSGWICLDKPYGYPSTRILNRIKSHFPKTKIGHAGTLDPLASGVLPVAIGEATKLISYAQNALKTYLFQVSWGQQTTTDDCEGEVVNQSLERPSQEDIKKVLPSFIGNIEQTPPTYSALKIRGKRAYDLARLGHTVSLSPRSIFIKELTLAEHTTNTTTFIATCGKGTYIRSLARDFGIQLGCYGHITLLKRLQVGPFSIQNSFDGKKLLETTQHPDIERQLMPLGCVLDDIPDIMVSKSQETLLRHGQPLPITHNYMQLKGVIACKRSDNTVFAMAEVENGLIHPKRVLNI